MNFYVVIAVVVGLAISHGTAYLKGANDKDGEYQLAIKDEQIAAFEIAAVNQEKANERANRLEESRRGIQSRLDVALERLRHRPDRMPDAARPNCQGATGVELSRPDAEFLEREAARADRIRAALGTCYEHVDSLIRPTSHLSD
jgi:hypothetical protein